MLAGWFERRGVRQPPGAGPEQYDDPRMMIMKIPGAACGPVPAQMREILGMKPQTAMVQ